jgi:hypothetical protein
MPRAIPTVRANPLKSNAGAAADGADANRPPHPGREIWFDRLGGAAVIAAEALRAARAGGIELGIDGNDLVLEASTPPLDAVLNLLSLRKAGHHEAAAVRHDGWSAEDWQAVLHERASIARHRLYRRPTPRRHGLAAAEIAQTPGRPPSALV